MEPLLILALFILVAIGLAMLVHWGVRRFMGDTPAVIVAGIVFVLVLLYALNQTGVLVL